MGHYVHLAKAKTFGHSKSITLQAKDSKCLGVAFELTGIGNAPYLYCKGISESIRERGVPIYGLLNINGGAASQDSYEAGARLRDAGVVTGNDASADHTFISMQWTLANLNPDLTPENYHKILQAGHHMDWDNGEHAHEGRINPVPDIFNEAAEGKGSFTAQHKDMTSRINSYRDWKYQQRKLRWISVEDPDLRERVIEHLPKADRGLVERPHKLNDNNWAKLLAA